MTSFLPDSNILVASLQPGHVHHQRALASLQARLNGGEALVLAAHTLLEAYSVLTRMPPPHRFSPRAAMSLLARDYLDRSRIVSLATHDYLELLSTAADRGITGGRVYDAVIARCAQLAEVDVILTFNARDFAGLAPGIAIVVPGAQGG